METLDLDVCKKEIRESGLLTRNTKLQKGNNTNIGLELLPSILSTLNTCPNAGKCKYTCIAFSGVGNLFKSKKLLNGTGLSTPLMKKARRTFVLINDKKWFEGALKAEIEYCHRMAQLNGEDVYFRLNVTSDLDWYHITNELPDINFYDYTKVWSRESTANYKLTYSSSEKVDNFGIMEKLHKGENVAMVFVGNKLPEKYFDIPVIDGDLNDDRSTDPRGVIVGLLIKTTVAGQDINSSFFVNV
jgi:hypothetical protein